MAEAEKFYHITPDDVIYPLNDGAHSFYWGEALGFGDMSEPIGERVPYQDGVEELGLYVPSRELIIPIKLMHDTRSQLKALDDTLHTNIAPHASDSLCTLRRITQDGRTRDIKAWMTHYPKTMRRQDRLTVVRPIKYWAPDPAFYDPIEQSSGVGVSGGGITFPITFPITFGATGIDDYVYPNNTGDIETWPVVKVQGTGGTNPTITNDTTGKKVDLSSVTLDVDDYVTIDMGEGTIIFYDDSAGTETNIIEKMSAASEFFPLVVGANTLHIEMGAATNATVTITHYRLYMST